MNIIINDILYIYKIVDKYYLDFKFYFFVLFSLKFLIYYKIWNFFCILLFLAHIILILNIIIRKKIVINLKTENSFKLAYYHYILNFIYGITIRHTTENLKAFSIYYLFRLFILIFVGINIRLLKIVLSLYEIVVDEYRESKIGYKKMCVFPIYIKIIFWKLMVIIFNLKEPLIKNSRECGFLWIKIKIIINDENL